MTGLVRTGKGIQSFLHDRKRKQDEDELAKVTPW
jgi:hypothetical protein